MGEGGARERSEVIVYMMVEMVEVVEMVEMVEMVVMVVMTLILPMVVMVVMVVMVELVGVTWALIQVDVILFEISLKSRRYIGVGCRV